MKYWNAWITPITSEKKITGVIIGSVTRRNFCHALAPSMSAASYSCCGTSRRPARKMIIASPTPHNARITSAHFDEVGE